MPAPGTPTHSRGKPFRTTVTARHAITLPADLRRQLDIVPGDAVEIVVEGQQAMLQKVPKHPTPELRGLLADYFTDREDIQRFVDHERSGWDE